MLRYETFEFDGMVFEVHAKTGMSELDRRELLQMLEGKTGRGELHNAIYAELVTQTSRIHGGELESLLPKPNAPLEAHLEAFPLVMGQSLAVINGWLEAIQKADTPIGTNPELQPGVETKDPKSLKNGKKPVPELTAT